MQIRPCTGKEIAQKLKVKKWNLADPTTNIRFGAYYFSTLRGKFDRHAQLYIAAYNMGAKNVRTVGVPRQVVHSPSGLSRPFEATAQQIEVTLAGGRKKMINLIYRNGVKEEKIVKEIKEFIADLPASRVSDLNEVVVAPGGAAKAVPGMAAREGGHATPGRITIFTGGPGSSSGVFQTERYLNQNVFDHEFMHVVAFATDSEARPPPGWVEAVLSNRRPGLGSDYARKSLLKAAREGEGERMLFVEDFAEKGMHYLASDRSGSTARAFGNEFKFLDEIFGTKPVSGVRVFYAKTLDGAKVGFVYTAGGGAVVFATVEITAAVSH
jgi:hypothetical protein